MLMRPHLQHMRLRLLLRLGLPRYCGLHAGIRAMREHLTKLLSPSSPLRQQQQHPILQHRKRRVLLLRPHDLNILRSPRFLPSSQYFLHWKSYSARPRNLRPKSHRSKFRYSDLHNPKLISQRLLQDRVSHASCSDHQLEHSGHTLPPAISQ